jgi:hypothetical protein
VRLNGRKDRVVRHGARGHRDCREAGGANQSIDGAPAGDVADQSNKMANTVAASSKLRKTYNPVNITSVRRFDEARVRGREAMQEEQKPTKSVIGKDGKLS